MNVHESEKLAGILEGTGYSVAADMNDADIIVINTCTIRQNAENRVVGNLGYIKKLKEKNKSLILGIFGCMPQADGAAQKLIKRAPFINIIFGTHNLYKFSDYLKRALEGEKVIEIELESKVVEGLEVKRTSGINAWVNIAYGCDNYCSYCIVPFVRGREKSREPQVVLKEVEDLLKQGYKEITLLGQNVNSYNGIDSNGEKKDFADLLENIALLPYKFRVRFMTSHPKDFSVKVIDAIARHKNLPPYFHLPAQSGSDRILKLMNRKYTAKHYLGLIDIIKSKIPDAGFSSDIIVGFPTETEEDFDKTLELVKKSRYHHLFSFIYSPRAGTKAAEMEGQIDKKTVDARFSKLTELQTKIGLEIAEKQVGKTVEILCDTFDKDKNTYRGKTENGKIVSFTSANNLVGEFVTLKVTKSKNSNLIGEMLSPH